MSHQAMTWAVAQRVGDPLAKAVLMNLANRADEEGRCYPGQDRIASDTEISLRTIKSKIAKLEKLGLLTRIRRDRNGSRLSDEYHLPVTESQGAGAAPRVGAKVQMVQGQGAGTAPSYKDEPSVELTDYIDRFDDFWAGYPKGGRLIGSKDATRRAWDRLPPVDRDKALAALPVYAKYCADQAGWYSPLAPLNYLRERRFDNVDAVPSERAGIVIRRGTPQWEAWWPTLKDWERAFIEKGNRDTWTVRSEWPPGHEPQSATVT